MDADEFVALAGNLGQLLDKAECKAALEAIDTSGDGKIQFDEFYKWLSTAPAAGEKGAAKMMKLRAALLTRNAIRFVRTLSSAPVDGGADIKFKIGEGECDKASVSAYLTKGHVLDQKVIDALPNGPGKEFHGIFISIDVKHNGGASFKKWVDDAAKNFIQLDDIISKRFFLTHPSEDVTRVNIVPFGRDFEQNFMGLFTVVEEKLGCSGVKVDLDNNPATCAREGFRFHDLFNAKGAFKGVIPPEVPAMLAQMKDNLPIPADQIPGLENLIANEQSFEADFTALGQMVLGKMFEGAPDECKDGDLRKIVDVICEKMGRYEKRDTRKGLIAFKLFLLVLKREIQEIAAIHVRTRTGYGASVEISGFDVENAATTLNIYIDRALTKIGQPER